MWLRFVGLLGIVLLACGQAHAGEMGKPAHKVWTTGFYVGGGVGGVHHTGYVPDTPWNSEQYAVGGKVFAGYRYLDWAQVEVVYHYLGEVTFDEGLPALSKEHSHAVSVVSMFVSQPLSTWLMPTLLPTRVLLRAGLGYKDISHSAIVGSFHEGVAVGVVGFGVEYELSNLTFVRLEYEFLTPAIGGTSRVINVMNTPLTVSFGRKF